MRLAATGSTTMGAVVLFWPELLPVDIERQLSEEPEDIVIPLAEEGKLLLLEVSPGGDYTLGVFIGETIPSELESFCTLLAKRDEIDIAGPSWFAGIEHLSPDAAALAKLSRRKCNEVAIPAGTYSAEIFSATYPDHVYEDWLRNHAGASAQRWWWVQTWFASLGIVALLIFVGCLFFGTRQSVWVSLAVSAALLFIAWLMSRTAGYAKIQQARRSYAAEHPDFVLRLRK
jgi:hypothetical protein